MEIDKVLDQAAEDIKSGEQDSTAGDGTQTIDTNGDSTQEQGSLGVGDVPEELKAKEKELLRAFHGKTQALAEERKRMEAEMSQYKQDATALYDLSKQEWFRRAIEEEKGRRKGTITHQITEEQFEALKSDPRAFAEFLAKRDQAVMDSLKSQFSQELGKLSSTTGKLAADREMESAANFYGDDFRQAKESGDLEAYLKDYDPKTAFKLYMADQGKVAVPAAKKRQQQDETEKLREGSVEKGGMSRARGGQVVKVRSLDESLDRIFELSARGVKDYKIQKA